MAILIDFIFEAYMGLMFILAPVVFVLYHSRHIAEGIGSKIFKVLIAYLPLLALLNIVVMMGCSWNGGVTEKCMGSDVLGNFTFIFSLFFFFGAMISIPASIILAIVYFKLHFKSVKEYSLKDTDKKSSDS